MFDTFWVYDNSFVGPWLNKWDIKFLFLDKNIKNNIFLQL